ncbi:MAG: ABC transporter ATP-binding protein [bacterium]
MYFKINELENQFGGFKLGPVSLEMEKGEYLALLGPTGCGKTSFMQSVAGISTKARGQILFNDHDISLLPVHKRKIGYVSQTSDLFPHLTVSENIAFGLRYLGLSHQERKLRLEKYLEIFNLRKLAGQSAYTLSGGERKKTAIARSLIIQPQLLLLDEPLGMLDHNGRKEMLDILKMIHNDLQTTTIHITHDRHEAWGVAQVCAVMNNGRILQSGSVAELFRKPETLFVAEFLGGRNIFKATFKDYSVELPWGDIKLSHMPHIHNGWVIIRPERIRLVSGDNPHKAAGTVSALHDFGEYLELKIEINKDTVLTVHSSINRSNDIHAGKAVCLDWPEDSMHIITRE